VDHRFSFGVALEWFQFRVVRHFFSVPNDQASDDAAVVTNNMQSCVRVATV
jgi:hypothetical protein